MSDSSTISKQPFLTQKYLSSNSQTLKKKKGCFKLVNS